MSKTWKEWVDYHAKMFAFDERSMIAAATWVGQFKARKFSPDELCEITDWLAMNDPPRWPDDHLTKIRERMDRIRAVEINRKEESDKSICTLCGNTGRIIVPHPDCCPNFQWDPIAHGYPFRYRACVRCRCWRGKSGNFDPRPVEGVKQEKMITIDDYERFNPYWRDQVKEREEEFRAISNVISSKDVRTPAEIESLKKSLLQPIGRMK